MLKKMAGIDIVNLARALIILEIAAVMFSTAAAVIVEVMIYFTFISSKNLHKKVFSCFHQPMVIMTLIIYAMVSLGVLYSAAPFSESIDMWGSWRKLLLIPLAASVYKNSAWKQRLVDIFIGISTLSALISFAGFFLHFTIYKFPEGIVVDNWATQGMLFSAAVFACIVMLRFPQDSSTGPFRAWMLRCTTLVIILNIIFVTPGRSGYLAFIILTMVFIFFGFQKKIKIFILAVAPLAIIFMLLVSPVAKNRIITAINEIQNYEQAPELTSMGIRIVMWKNTVKLLKHFEHPVLGYGTSGFETAYKKQVAGQKGWQAEIVGDPHNQYLRILVEYGFVGLILFMIFIFSFFKQKIEKPFYILGTGVLLAWCATSMFSAHFTTFSEGRFLMIWCGALLSVDTGKKQEIIPERTEN